MPTGRDATLTAVFLRVAALIEGLRLDEELRVGGIVIAPVDLDHGFAGRELREPMNALLAERDFVSVFDRPIWGAQIGPRHRLSFAVAPAIEVPDVVSASQAAATRLAQLVDALNVTHGGAPRVFAAVHELSQDGERWQPFTLMVGGGTHPGSALERAAEPGDQVVPIQPLELWTRAMNDPLISLWQSLYRGISAEQAWDVRIFRACSLLEAIGRELLPANAPVRRSDGEPLLTATGEVATTKTLRGKVFALANRAAGVAVTSPRPMIARKSHDLWDEVGVWVDIRNMVAHEGTWKPPGIVSTLPTAQRRSAAELDSAGLGDGLEGGALRYANAVAAATEAVLRSVVLSQPGDAEPRDAT
jgi:hypothetical protein